ncbi:hypothetical protein GWI33_001228 [Rhynchophorus ferrugineus]|uniref:non-specific serine/threonine protein kinase n=1 Tax=Rhynchophorus ferrugineus TaxID=354439 RepID=A0A834ISJ2_RHYFE|nr:hypothetical protein GWI33_001228 [Rhynchophorus ferrugineus]
METSTEPVSVRLARLNKEIISKPKNSVKPQLLNRECILDALQVLYESCSIESLQKRDQNIADFTRKYKQAINDINALRVNISDFEIKNVIGCGHFGQVHVVKEKQTGDVYAMKTIRKFDNETKRVSFEEERNIMAFSNSQWLTSLQYAFQDNYNLFFVMDYHPGGDLLGLLQRQGGTLPESAAVFYLAELTLALQDLHKLGYVHRDIKPDNILLDRCGHLKLADFGSAAKLDKNGVVMVGPPVGTPDYIAPEVLQCLENRHGTSSYGVSCDFWSMGVLAYEMTIGNLPFQGHSTTALYSKIMNHPNNLKFPADISLTQGYISFIKGLITDMKSRLNRDQIKGHAVFKTVNFDVLQDQVPPFVPKIKSFEDTSNFNHVQVKKRNPIDNFKTISQFSGRNLPFIGFTFTQDHNGGYETTFSRGSLNKSQALENMKTELDVLRMKVSRSGDFNQEKENLEKKLEEKSRKLESIEALRDKLEKDLASNMAECTALKRTLDLERKDRAELEKKALELIRSAKLKWEISEKTKTDALNLEIQQQKEKIAHLVNTNKTLEEQLQRALKTEEKNRRSLETVENLSRRSVVSLEHRLEKITSEAQENLIELQSRLSAEVHSKNLLEKEISTLREHEADLSNKLQASVRNYNDLKTQIDDAESVIKELSEKANELEKDIEEKEIYKLEVKKLQSQFEDSQKSIKDLQNKNITLQNENKIIAEQKTEMNRLKQELLRLQNDDKVRVLEDELHQEREKYENLNKRLQEAESAQVKSQELKEKQLQFWKLEKELSNCKLDKRIAERELKDAQNEIKDLKDNLSNSKTTFNEFKKCQEEALLELSSINENISMELMKCRENNKILQEQINSEKGKNDLDKALINELKNEVRNRDDRIRCLENDLTVIKEEVKNLEKGALKQEQERAKMVHLVEELQKEKTQLFNETEQGKRETKNVNLNLNALREACVLLENQVVEYEHLLSSANAKESELKANTEKLIGDLCQSKQETQEAKKQINEQKSLKAVAEQKIKRLQEDKDCLEKECADYKLKCMEYKQMSSGLSDQLMISDDKLSNAEVEIKSLERQIGKFLSENKLLKEELSECLTSMTKLKDSNYRFSHQLEDLRKNNEGLIQKIRELETVLEEKNIYCKERELKSEATISQQIKLIDYLQSKIDEPTHKKKRFADVIFGSKKENQAPISLAMNYKDMESELTKEREHNRKLKEEVFKLKAATMNEFNSNISEKMAKMGKIHADILSPRTKEALTKIVNSPGSQKGDFSRHNSVQRMHHNIPHRFETRLCTNPLKCSQCNNQINIGRNYHVCKECKITAHSSCSTNLPKTCGLPREYMKHFTNSLQNSPNNSEKSNGDSYCQEDLKDAVYEGWVKIPCSKTNSWVKRYAYLTTTSLEIYSLSPKDPATNLLESFDLKPEGGFGKIILEPVQSEIGISVATSDLPFILKVEVSPNTTCWPSRCVILMALSAKEKDGWFDALQRTVVAKEEVSTLETVMTLPEEMVVNCVLDLTDSIKVLGTDKGLFAYYEDKLLAVQGLSKVEQIAIFSPGNVVLMIAGPKANLISCDVNHLINLVQCGSVVKLNLKYRPVNVKNLNGFHILQISKQSRQMKIAVAITKQLVLLEYCFDTAEFVPVCVLDTAQPTSCLLFTENSLIVGADKFFEIDLNTLKAEEFLDVSDVNLKQAVNCYKMGSFPIHILQVSDNPREYLAVFNEFSVFVDEYGRSSRLKELKSNHIPLAVHLSKNYLYVVQFAAVEILKITDETCNAENAEPYRLEMTKFRYVGYNPKGIYVEQGRRVLFLNARNLPDFDAVSLLSTENASEATADVSSESRFSFTSSIVQSLDGHLSDSGHSERSSVQSERFDTIRKKVTFSQTDL